MRRTLLILFMILLQLQLVHAISQEPYCYAASDFMVLKHQDIDPQIIALYDDTKVYFDVNHDGVWEYQKTLDASEKYVADVNWELTDGSYIHSDKPIIYNQLTYSSYGSLNYQCIPPISAWKKEIVLFPLWMNPSSWKIISPDATITMVGSDEAEIIKDLDIFTSLTLVRDNKNFDKIWYINSTKPVIATSISGLSAGVGKDFLKVMSGNTMIIAIEDNTQVSFDKNSDGIFDEDIIVDRGFSEMDLPAGTRIRSNKKIGVFESERNEPALDYSPAIPTRSANDELYVTVYQPGKNYITGLFNDDEGFFNTTYEVHDEGNDLLEWVLSNSARSIPSSVRSNAARIKAERPVAGYYHNYQKNGYFKYQRPMQTIEPYITSFSRKKFLGLNDTAIINVRVLNPTSYDLENIKISIRYTDDFKSSEIKYYISTRDLETDEFTVDRTQKTEVPLDYGNIKEFVVNVDSIASGEYVDIDYYLTTPEIIGDYMFPSASMTYESQIWNYN